MTRRGVVSASDCDFNRATQHINEIVLRGISIFYASLLAQRTILLCHWDGLPWNLGISSLLALKQ
jgi:hypothetical protein